ncbi:MAG TPA: capsule assembly Wzi family protein [Bacteroidota bacterium]|nr:capsule assembly Wzi family protein [Bacteroidota bacterium]
MVALSLLGPTTIWAQAEDVPAENPVYSFLKKMSVEGLIEGYDGTIVPISRREVAGYLKTLDGERSRLSVSEQGWLDDYLSEFHFDLTGNTDAFHSLIDTEEPTVGDALLGTFSNREKYLYHAHDSTLNVFVNGLVDVDYRGIHGDDLGTNDAAYLQLGGRLRGTIYGKVGYFLQVTNAGFRGSRELLQRDPILSQSHELSVTNTRNFDFAEGYLRYDGGLISAQIGRERVLWGSGYEQKLTISDNIGLFDFVRADFHYKAFKYTFLHASLMGQESNLAFKLPFDTSATFSEPVAADKYLAVHRFELSFPKVLDLGFQEMVVYSNRAPDLAYLNPLMLFESAQRARGDRDNMFWLFDIRTHFLENLELTGSILYDDFNLPDLFSDKWSDRYGWQAGMYYADMFGIRNTALTVEYTRIQPYVFSHGRSREDSYTSQGRLIGTSIGPNADNMMFGINYWPLRNLTFSVRVNFMRKGLNIVDSTGALVRNVGGDVFAPHRDTDPEMIRFLDGNLEKMRTIQLSAVWEIVNQWWIQLQYLFDSTEMQLGNMQSTNGTFIAHLKVEL